MYPPALAEVLRSFGIETSTVAEWGLAGRSDTEVLDAAVADNRVLLTENVSDFARIAAELTTAGRHHPGVLIALSSRFSRRPMGIPRIAAAISALAGQDLGDCLAYLEPPPE